MKCYHVGSMSVSRKSRSREGAWIEIETPLEGKIELIVAPARERGLKFLGSLWRWRLLSCRSREGAWIEIPATTSSERVNNRRSREGAWIEIAE